MIKTLQFQNPKFLTMVILGFSLMIVGGIGPTGTTTGSSAGVA